MSDTAMESLARILYVDDDEALLKALGKALRLRYDVTTVRSGAEALSALAMRPDIAVIISDMWMPEMDGIELLRRAREICADIVCVLLTGQPELQTAIEAVNRGHVFRFLTKPIPVHELLSSVDVAVMQYRLVTAERVLLEETLRGSILALTDALSVASPIGFGRATRVKELVTALAAALDIGQAWQVEVAAMLSQLACITLPAETVQRVCYGRELSPDEARMVADLPAVTEKLLGHIPRLEIVREILSASQHPARPIRKLEHASVKVAREGAEVLRAALDYDLLYIQGHRPEAALALMRSRTGHYDQQVLDALARIHGEIASAEDLRELPLSGLCVGMVLLDDMRLDTGMLLVCAGAPVTVGLLERLKNLPRGSVAEPVRVNASPARLAATA